VQCSDKSQKSLPFLVFAAYKSRLSWVKGDLRPRASKHCLKFARHSSNVVFEECVLSSLIASPLIKSLTIIWRTFDATQPQKPHWESVQACLCFSFLIGFSWNISTWNVIACFFLWTWRCFLHFSWCVKRPITYAWNCFQKRYRGPSFKIRHEKTYTNYFKFSFFNHYITDWNSNKLMLSVGTTATWTASGCFCTFWQDLMHLLGIVSAAGMTLWSLW